MAFTVKFSKVFPNVFLFAAATVMAGCFCADYADESGVPGGDGKPRLMLWVKAEDLVGKLKDAGNVTVWPDASGLFNDLTDGVKDATAPSFKESGENGRPAVVFAGDARAKPKVVQALKAPLTGEWKGTTIFLVGSNLGSSSGWFGTGNGQGELRSFGPFQHCGSKNSFGFDKFAPLKGKPGPQLATVECGMDEKGAMNLTAYANGQQVATSSDPFPNYGVTCNSPTIGSYGTDVPHSGELYEMLIYKGVLTGSERRSTEEYLMAKYGLASSTPETAKAPAGYLMQKTASPPPALKNQPCQNGLQLWAAADDITGEDRQEVAVWQNHAGDKKPLTAIPGHSPKLVKDSVNGHAVLRFEAVPSSKPPVYDALELPLKGVWQELTLISVGRNLNGNWWFKSSNGKSQLRGSMSFAQHTGSSKFAGRSAALIGGEKDVSIGALIFGKLGDTGQYLKFNRYGYNLGTLEDPSQKLDIIFDKASIFEINNGISADLAELLIYNRALTDAERQQTERYLAEKYALPLKSAAEIAKDPTPRSKWSLSERQLPRHFSWLGNSESGKESWIQHGIFSICSLPDGRVAAISVWDEAHKEIGLYENGKSVTETSEGLPSGISGGGGMIATDGKHLYAGITPGGKTPKPPAGIRRLSFDLKEMPWPDLPKGRIKIDTTRDWQEIDGLAIIGRELFATLQHADGIRVYDAETGAFRRHLEVAAHGRLTADLAGLLWAADADGAIQMEVSGKPTGRKITGVSVGGLAVNPKGQLLIADKGKRQQVIVYDINGIKPVEVSTIGEPRGVYANRGIMSDTRLVEPSGVGVDAQGNVTVSGGWRIMNYGPDGKFRWKVICTHFCIVGDFDPGTDGNDIYTKNFHYAYKPGKAPGDDWEWVGYTADPTRFPEMATGGAYTIIRRLNGNLYRFRMAEGAEGVVVSRKEKDSEFFIPCAVVQTCENKTLPKTRLKAAPETGRYIWTDTNGNGLAENDEISMPPEKIKYDWSKYLFVDSQAGIWQPQGRTGMRYFPCTGFTESGAPVYTFATEKLIPRPPEFIDVRRTNYYPETDTMYLSGYTWENQAVPGEWVTSGSEIIRYDNWSKPTRKTACRIPFPTGATISSWDVVPKRNLLFAGELGSSVVFVYNTKNGKLLGIVEPDPDKVGGVGWLDFPGGAIHAFERKNGEIIISLEECFREKELVFRIPPGFEN
jgi:hypothetical protein